MEGFTVNRKDVASPLRKDDKKVQVQGSRWKGQQAKRKGQYLMLSIFHVREESQQPDASHEELGYKA